jgi:hypothetical protein
LVDALRETHRHIEELERIQAGSRSCLIAYEAKARALMLTERIIALSKNIPTCVKASDQIEGVGSKV